MDVQPSARSREGCVTTVDGTVYDKFRRTVATYPQNEFLCVLPGTATHYDIAPGSFSYDQVARQVERLRADYHSAGLQSGHRAGLLLENRPELFTHWLALNALGVSVVPIPAEWRRSELQFLVGHAEISVAIVTRDRQDDLTEAARALGRELVVSSASLDGLSRVPCTTAKESELPDERTECALLYTSGTTGSPKGCVLTNEYYLRAGSWYLQVGGLCALSPGRDRLLTPLPMSHMNAMAFSTMAMLMSGGCIIPLDRFHPTSWWACVEESRATIVHYLGVMPAMLLGFPSSPRDRQHCVRFGFGAGVNPRLHAAFEERFGFPLLEAWAMTETGAGAVSISSRAPRKVGTACFGRPGERVEYRIVDDAGRDVRIGEAGELLVRAAGERPGFGFFREYLKDPRATADAWADGWFHTGDIVCADPDGDLHFVDRRKNVIRRSGENISAAEVEGVILQHPGVAAVGITAVPDEVRGDEVMACVITRTALGERERAALAVELVEFCRERLAYFKAPGYIAFCERLPLTPTEKIQRAGLRELARELLGSARTIDLRGMKTPVRTPGARSRGAT